VGKITELRWQRRPLAAADRVATRPPHRLVAPGAVVAAPASSAGVRTRRGRAQAQTGRRERPWPRHPASRANVTWRPDPAFNHP